ncbi:TonB-dependent receptor-like, beta-barrel [Candidatus Methylopumilus universalis]
MIFDRGYAGASYAKHQTQYGSPLESAVSIDMDNDRFDFASEIRDLGNFFDRAKFRAAYTDYMHKEIENGSVNTAFKNQCIDGTFELGHQPLLSLKGVVGLQFESGKFQALGAEAFVPSSKTNSQSIYLYEELPIDKHKVTFGLRHGQHDVDSKGGGNFIAANKNFKTNNSAIGGLYTLNSQWSLTGNLSHNERAPSYFELYANGVHAATGTYEQGQANLKIEKSNGLDGQIRWKSGQDSLTLGAYYTNFSNYIGLRSTNDTQPVGLIETHKISQLKLTKYLNFLLSKLNSKVLS